MTLGLAGGPLLVALVLGYFGRIGRVAGHIPRPTRLLLQELGLVLFLAHAGLAGGRSLASTIAAEGPVVFGAAAIIALGPILVAYPFARRVLKFSRGQALGGICGGMTSTPALGALTRTCTSQQPIVAYATAYPVALITMSVMAKLLLEVLAS
jgi:putative transport protein